MLLRNYHQVVHRHPAFSAGSIYNFDPFNPLNCHSSIQNRYLHSFRERAGIVGSNLDAKGYRIVELNINTSSQRPPVPYQARMATMEAAAPVVTEAGDSDIRVTINGTVELQLP